MSTITRPLEPLLRSMQNTNNADSHAFVIPRERGTGFQASIRGQVFDLGDPSSGHALAPTPDELRIVSIASELAWSTRRFLRAHGLPDDVSVSANWRTHDDQLGLADINLTVTLPRRAEAVSAALATAFANTLAARSLAEPVVHISLEGANR
jgi:hypothetical protein